MNDTQPTKCYRLRRDYLYLGIVGSILCLIFGTGFSLAAFWNLDGSFRYPVPTAIFIVVFFSFFMLLGIWIILAYYRERLEILRDALIKHDVFHVTEIAFDEITQLQWFSMSGAILVESRFQKFKIHIDNFQKAEQIEITECLRNSIEYDLQEGWDKYRRLKSSLFETAEQPVKPVRLLPVILVLNFAGVFFIAWWYGRGVHYLVVSLINLVVAIRWFSRFSKERLKTSSSVEPE
ncbi:hypothetical protein [Gimesia maris]|uniref:hypothetical protein n=1 Tax=Gimesia maris TaxID=122 RepID=UPI00242047BE|nr:hypothetical protein [Gimesia maris]|tara:strand:+ start:469900 stop:470604 length:705 start_codon:yes stop_codon:yes gene_type:complete